MAIDPQAEQSRVARLLTGSEPAGISPDYLVVPEAGTAYVPGTTARYVGLHSIAADARASGFVVAATDPAHFAFMGTYVTLGEYFPDDLLPGGVAVFVDGLAARGPGNSHLHNIVAINELSKRDGELVDLTREFQGALEPRVRERFDAAMREPTGGLGRQLLAPQPLLHAIRWLLARDPNPATDAIPNTNIGESIVLVHALAATLEANDDAEDVDSVESTKRLMLALMNLGALNDTGDLFSSIDRTIRLWRA